jgi:hypothetical protein
MLVLQAWQGRKYEDQRGAVACLGTLAARLVLHEVVHQHQVFFLQQPVPPPLEPGLQQKADQQELTI